MDEAAGGLAPAMTVGELAALRECYSRAGSLVEFGCGGSTLLALRSVRLGSIWSVESDPAWIERLRSQGDVVDAERSGRLRLLHADIGAVGGYGMPTDEDARDRWPAYHEMVWDDPRTRAADLVLVDGRFRVACALAAVALCQPHTVLLVHDFWTRPVYHPVLAFTDWLGSCDSLAILRRKPQIDVAKLAAVREAYRFNPD